MSPADAALPDCQRCGACCAHFRVSFYWAEALTLGLEDHRYEPIGRWFVCMSGTQGAAPRCHALEGVVGESVGCSIYARRPSPCQELQPGDPGCWRARARHGLPVPEGLMVAASLSPPGVPEEILPANVSGA